LLNWLNIRIVALLALSLVAFSLSGCGEVKVGSPQPGAAKETLRLEAAPGEPRRDLAVISLDLDPPVRLLTLGQAAPNITLLAAIDNKGNTTERNVVVRATLRSSPSGELLVEYREVLPCVVPGEATLVKFSGLPSIPPRGGYELTVAVDPVPGETILANNVKTLPFQLVLSR
jgi:hypothetical protein